MPRPRKTPKANSTSTKKEMERRLAELEEENKQLKGSETIEISLDSLINVVSLCPYELVLSTGAKGQGRKFYFHSFGETKPIVYRELLDIFEHYRRFLEAGMFYVMDKRVVRKHGLEELYNKILDKSMMEKVFATDKQQAVEFYKQASPTQQEMIEVILAKKVQDGTADLNVVSAISLVANKDIERTAREAKAIRELPNE